ncbi:MAG: DNA-deoxyinosine glycosylase [Burkholderiales bacterium]|nr:DNA-deoxyinosine glycosylase [Burkholderiales bacterium]
MGATPRVLDSRLRGNDEIRLIGLDPVVSPTTRLLVLGSFPGVASLRAHQYYAHPRNHFWPIVGRLLGVKLAALPYEQRLSIAHERGLGIWDTYAACQREGSLDSAIEKAEFNDLAGLVATLPLLRGIAHNGGESARGLKFTASFGVPVFKLPSTSPANASWHFERKLQAWHEAFVACSLIPA